MTTGFSCINKVGIFAFAFAFAFGFAAPWHWHQSSIGVLHGIDVCWNYLSGMGKFTTTLLVCSFFLVLTLARDFLFGTGVCLCCCVFVFGRPSLSLSLDLELGL